MTTLTPADFARDSTWNTAPAATCACAHCGLAVPAGLIDSRRQEQFCCRGCETAWGLIHSCGLEHYYRLARGDFSAAAPVPAQGAGDPYEEYDDPAFLTLYAHERGGVHTVTLVLEGVHCAACVWLLERVPGVIPGVLECRVNFGRSEITIVWDQARVPLSRVARFIDGLGYRSMPRREHAVREVRLREDRAAIIRIGIAGALFGNTTLMAFALYGGAADGAGQSGMGSFLRAVSAVLAVVSVFGPGAVFYRAAAASLRVRALHMDVPIALALTVGLVHGLINTVRGAGEVYFDTLTTLVFLLLIGRWIQQRQQRRSADAVEMLYQLTPRRAHRIEESGVRTVPVEALRAGDLVEVGPGEAVPADGEVVLGDSSLNTSWLTGESKAAEVAPGDTAAAGAINLTSPLRLRVTATGAQTRLGRLMSLVEEHARRKAPIVRLADRLSRVFVAVVLSLAAATYGAWLLLDPTRAAENAVALLVITCPCALGLATPLAVVSAIGRAARRGILIKGGATLEILARRGTIVFDKTGTLTTGLLRVDRYHGPNRLKPIIAAIERGCVHPAARAMAAEFDGPTVSSIAPTVRHSLGGGMEAEVDGSTITLGSERFVLARIGQPALPCELERIAREGADAGLSPIIVADNGAATGVVLLADEVRAEAAEVLASVRRTGWRPIILSGDDPRVVRRIGEALGVPAEDVFGGASPEVKIDAVREHAARGPVLMVGDGVNDAAALAAATVGIAVQGGAEAALSAADVSLTRPDLGALPALLHGARGTLGAIKRNLAVSLGYNLLFGGLAIAGQIDPLAAAVLMPLSGLSVLGLSLSSRAFAERELEEERR